MTDDGAIGELAMAAIILAAGASTRMGSPKPVLGYRNSTMVGAVVDTAAELGLDPIIVVTGYHHDEVAVAVTETARIVRNSQPEHGNLSSLLVGLDAVPDGSDVVVLLADMPDVQGDVVADLVSGVNDSGSRAGWVEYTNGRGHPLVLARPAFADVRELAGSRPLWPFLSSLPPEDCFVLAVDDLRPIDVNTPEDHAHVDQRPPNP